MGAGPGEALNRGENAADVLFGGDGNARLDGGTAPEVLHGGPGDDVLIGGSSRDRLYGGRGNDTIDAVEATGLTDRVINCGPGYDRVIGDPHDRRLRLRGCESFVVGR